MSALAGCVTEPIESAELPDETVAVDATVPDYALDLGFDTCDEQLGLFPVPAEFAGDLPPGFKVETVDPAGRLGMMAVVSASCTQGTIGGVDGGERAFVIGLIMVEPPAEYRVEGSLHAVPFAAIASTDELVTTFEAWNFGDVLKGDITVGGTATPVARVGHMLAATTDMTVHMYSAIAGAELSAPAGAVRAFAFDGDELSHVVDWEWSAAPGLENGEATFEVMYADGISLFPPAQPGLAAHYWGISYGLRAMTGEDFLAGIAAS